MTMKNQTGAQRKQNLYFPKEVLEEIKAEAARLDRSLSWVMHRAWKMSREKFSEIPTPPEL